MKIYIIILSKTFMKGHPKAGQPTNFREKFLNGEKIHTIRQNYDLWQKRIEEVREGKAILSIREWEDKAYRSKQYIIKDLEAADSIGCQCLDCDKPFALEIDGKPLKYHPDEVLLANNDGLKYADFDSWFNIQQATGQKAIIQFTSFRYQ